MTTINSDDLLSVRPLGGDDWRRAYSVVQAVFPGLSAEQWHQRLWPLLDAADAGGEPMGACVLTCPNDYFYGLFTYGVCHDPDVGRTLAVADFCVATLTSRQSATDRLIRHAERLAREADCDALSVTFLGEKAQGDAQPRRLPLDTAFLASGQSLPKLTR
jgi:hypothetical protein